MKKERFSKYQMIGILRFIESGRLVKDIFREHGIAESTHFKWRSKYGGMEALEYEANKILTSKNSLFSGISQPIIQFL